MINLKCDDFAPLLPRLTDYQTKTLKKVLKYLEGTGESVLEFDMQYYDSESEVADFYLVLENSTRLVKNIQICPEDDTFVSIIGKKDWGLDDLYKLEL